jgi:hypothetical protein
MNKLFKAFKAFWGVLKGDKPLKEEIDPQQYFENGVIYTMLLFQREGRLIDFLQENIDNYDDSQVGAAVRQIHADCSKVLKEHLQLEPVLHSPEGESVTIPDSFDPSEIKVSGNLPGKPPYIGTLQHKGWMVSKLNLPSRNESINPKVVYPAEVVFENK